MAIAVVIGGHVGALALLAWHRGPGAASAVDERMTLIVLPPLAEASLPATPEARRRQPAAAATIEPHPPDPTRQPDDATAITLPEPLAYDWHADGTDAARSAADAAAAPATRDFGFPKRAPAPREKKEFGWDKTHTERVQARDGGGIGIHLSDNCDLVIAPFPMAGCAFGKRKTRGDLFDEMQAPPEMGDWKR
jgi:hypothetical protein